MFAYTRISLCFLLIFAKQLLEKTEEYYLDILHSERRILEVDALFLLPWPEIQDICTEHVRTLKNKMAETLL